MHVIRCRTATGSVVFATDFQAGHAIRLEGSLADGFHRTFERVTVAELLPPVVPAAIIGIGLNYRRHAAEVGAKPPEYPVVFFKSPGAVVASGTTVLLPRTLTSTKVDYEAELAVVISRPARDVRPADALQYVGGYCCANDVSARDWQIERGGSQWSRGKSFDTFCPLGPGLVTADEIPDPNALAIGLRLNGETRQASNTADMIFSVREIIAFLSADTTLLPGTVILTGTPEGVGMGQKPPRFLQAGDVMEVEIAGLGTLRNTVG